MTTIVEPILNAKDLESNSSKYDCVMIVFESLESETFKNLPIYPKLAPLFPLDKTYGTSVTFTVFPDVAGGRLILSPTGSLDGDGDDVRRYGDAAAAACRRALSAGCRAPALLLLQGSCDYDHFVSVGALGALAEGYELLQARETGTREPLERLGFSCHALGMDEALAARTARVVEAIERGRRVSRDIGTGDPERMAPARCAEYLRECFRGTDVRVEVLDDADAIRERYPCAHAVARASCAVPRHRPCIVTLSYAPATAARTLLMAGKGIVYDTGGADIKAGGIMAGMSRDKGGAASLAGFMKSIAELCPPNLAVRMELGFVRNSVGADSYVADEIITTRAGVRVQVGNTDAEGRMVLCELLASLREFAEAEKPPQPLLMTCATLTGHAPRAVGPYSIALDNRAAQQEGEARRLQAAGEAWGDCFEVSTLRREDFAVVKQRSNAMDVLQCNNAASSATPRGHQFPAAFLLRASGIHGTKLPFTHMDIAGSFADNYQFGKGTGSPVTALVARFVLENEGKELF